MAKRRHDPTPTLPPRVPEGRVQLERAIALLGCRVQGDLRVSVQSELIGLVGRYPDAQTAANWKLGLKSIRNDEIFDRTA